MHPRLDGDVLELAEGRFELDLAAHLPDERLELLERQGVETAVISLQPTLELERAPELADAYHEGIQELVAASGGRLWAFAAGRCLDGFTGACVPASALLSGLGDLPGELERSGQVLFVHPGPPAPPPAGAPRWWAAVVDYAAQMQAGYAAWISGGAERHPELPVVFAILGGGAPVQLERLRSRGVDVHTVLNPSVYFETASYGRRALALCLETYGVTQLLYGSDVPVVDPGPTLRALEELGDRVRQSVRVENPTRLFR